MFLCTFLYIVCTKKDKNMKNIAILASGEGTNAERIIRYFEEKEEVNVAVVIVSRASAGVIKRVEHLHVPCRVVTSAGFASGEALQVLQEYKTDFVVLAGFLLRIPDAILHAYPKRMVNIHPSLLPLPKFGGKGMYGIHVHEAVLKAGEEESGITIQYINEKYDEGDYIFQARCLVLPDDTPEALAERVHQLEYQYYPEVIEKLVLCLK